MIYLTIDTELADRMLPSICSITIRTWEDGKNTNIYSTLINPDCEIEEFLKNRHGITQEMVSNAPTLPEIWKTIYDLLENKLVFAHFANDSIRRLMTRASVDYLNVPNLFYGCTASIAKRTWPEKQDFKLINLSESLNITKIHNDSSEDSKTIGLIISEAFKKNNVNSIEGLFEKIGFAGGQIVNNIKLPYRAIKDKKENIFVTKTKTKDCFIVKSYKDFLTI